MRHKGLLTSVSYPGFLFLACLVPSLAQRQELLTISDAMALALQNYPLVRAAEAQRTAAAAGVGLARTAYLPRTDLLWQQNRATRNNVFGLLLPQSVIPSVSGPVLGTQSYQSTWGSATGVLFSWEPFDFGLRKANINVAEGISNQATASLDLTRLEVAAAAADAFLAVLAAEQIVRAAQANVERMQVFARSVGVLVDNQLRPGADASRAEAELAAARIQLIQAEQSAAVSRATLAESLGLAGASVALEGGVLFARLPHTTVIDLDYASHPRARHQAAALEAARARERALDRSYFPRFNFQSAYSGRASGALVDGRFGGGAEGLFPRVSNWVAGLSVSFPALEIFGIRERQKIEANNAMAERARYDQVIQSLKAQDARSRALLDGARRVADNTPLQLQAAQEAESRARARYDAGLAAVIEVAEAQRLLAQAEIDDSVARLGVWRALLGLSKTRGNLSSFLQQVGEMPLQEKK